MYGMGEADRLNNLLVRADCKTTAVLPVYELDKFSKHSYIMCINTHTWNIINLIFKWLLKPEVSSFLKIVAMELISPTTR